MIGEIIDPGGAQLQGQRRFRTKAVPDPDRGIVLDDDIPDVRVMDKMVERPSPPVADQIGRLFLHKLGRFLQGGLRFFRRADQIIFA